MRYIFLLFILMPIVEIALIIQVGQSLGVVPTVALILITAAIGTFLLRREGVATLFRARQKMESGELPAHEMAEGIMLAFAGALLLTPGFVTDIVGFSLLSRTVRKNLIQQFSGHFKVVGSGNDAFHSDGQSSDSDYIDAEYHREEK